MLRNPFSKSSYRYSVDFTALDGLLAAYPEIYIVHDRAVSALAGRIAAFPSLGSRLRGVMALDACEASKTFDTVLSICSFLLEHGASRGAFVLGVGGGVTTDMTGFAAAIYKRGVKVGFVPTTLLSMVDAAIGGKNGVDYKAYKNMLGTFHQPEFVFSCPDSLVGLPQREFLCGMAEMLKMFLITSARDYAQAVEYFSSCRGAVVPDARLGEFVRKAAQGKVEIVRRDPLETKGLRVLLNLGHSYAHAIEHLAMAGGGAVDGAVDGASGVAGLGAASGASCAAGSGAASGTSGAAVGTAISHGEAVAIGIVMAARLTGEELSRRIAEDFTKCGLPVECPFPSSEMLGALSLDKKVDSSGKLTVVVPLEPGKVITQKKSINSLI